jgi:hypothetical protein
MHRWIKNPEGAVQMKLDEGNNMIIDLEGTSMTVMSRRLINPVTDSPRDIERAYRQVLLEVAEAIMQLAEAERGKN